MHATNCVTQHACCIWLEMFVPRTSGQNQHGPRLNISLDYVSPLVQPDTVGKPLIFIFNVHVLPANAGNSDKKLDISGIILWGDTWDACTYHEVVLFEVLIGHLSSGKNNNQPIDSQCLISSMRCLDNTLQHVIVNFTMFCCYCEVINNDASLTMSGQKKTSRS